MTDHGSRSHVTWSASATARNWSCPGALTLTAKLPRTTNSAAAWGTCAHQISERCFRNTVDAIVYLGQTETADGYSFPIDEEMAETSQDFVDYVRGRFDEYNALRRANGDEYWHPPHRWVEQNFSLADLKPPFEAGGTGDVVMWFPGWKLLEIVDLKGGRGVVVEAKGNPQMRTYALGAMLANPGLPVERVMTTIVQPRAPHKDGRIRSETFHVTDLMEWTADLVAAMYRAQEAADDHGSQMSPAEWNAKYLKAGDWCKFCPAAGFCPALEQRATDAAGIWFDDLDQPRISNSPDSMDATELAKKLDSFDMISEWMNAVRSYAHTQAENGVEIPGYQLVEKVGNRAWIDEKVTRLKLIAFLGKDDLDIIKLKSPAQIEKMLGAKRKHLIEDFVERPARGTNLVAVTKTSRPAATPAVNKFFTPLEN